MSSAIVVLGIAGAFSAVLSLWELALASISILLSVVGVCVVVLLRDRSRYGSVNFATPEDLVRLKEEMISVTQSAERRQLAAIEVERFDNSQRHAELVSLLATGEAQ